MGTKYRIQQKEVLGLFFLGKSTNSSSLQGETKKEFQDEVPAVNYSFTKKGEKGCQAEEVLVIQIQTEGKEAFLIVSHWQDCEHLPLLRYISGNHGLLWASDLGLLSFTELNLARGSRGYQPDI